jgi:hypothetical protein
VGSARGRTTQKNPFDASTVLEVRLIFTLLLVFLVEPAACLRMLAAITNSAFSNRLPLSALSPMREHSTRKKLLHYVPALYK